MAKKPVETKVKTTPTKKTAGLLKMPRVGKILLSTSSKTKRPLLRSFIKVCVK
jgi:hypothetical protein